ncbi:hypothetical protein V501_00236 [Pseudogymnoascus sp. VKM F-4519 (FW-2642)]|nr:hypothetical protein V501_00236 [Pseudogymnoascus sp. VKM F-4519 (FW-2642)]
MQHSSAEAIEGVERAGHAPGTTGTTAMETDATRLRNGGGSVRDDGMYPTTDNKASTDRDSLRKVDIESNDTDDVKVGKVHQDEEVRSEDEQPGAIKKFIAKYRKQIRIAIHVIVGTVMTG